MTKSDYVFNDGLAYENLMGVWSRLVGAQFLAWLAPPPGLAWADIGCGNGCSTEQLFERAAPCEIEALDPSAEQLAHARALLAGRAVTFHQGDAMALPWADASFDIAQMALVIFFVPEPAQGLAEMIRVTRPGGTVAAYAWDVPNHGLPWTDVWRAQERLALPVIKPPSVEVSALGTLEALWRAGGLDQVEARHITVERRFPDLETYWQIWWQGSPTRGTIPPERVVDLRAALRDVLDIPEGKPFTVKGTASAVKGRVPG